MKTMFPSGRPQLAHHGRLALLALAVFAPPATPLRQGFDEGMWPFDHPPLALLRDRYDFEPNRSWFDHLRLSTVRLQNGGTGAFISPEGLVLTNHHLVMRSLQRASSDTKDLLQDGFLATTRDKELRCEELSLTILEESRDVTDTLRPASDPTAAQRKLLNTLRREGKKKQQVFRVQRLYGGEKYVLHRSRRYRDVRLVWAPEMNVGFFGGDSDNFTYPRFCLDVALLRVYENDKPLRTKEHLTLNKKGAQVGELVFVSGHPAHTNRRQTVAQLVAHRDVTYPVVISGLRARRRALQEYAKKGPEEARAVRTDLFHIQNSLKLMENRLAALQNERLLEKKRDREHALLQTEEGKKVKGAFAEIWKASDTYAKAYVPRWLGRIPGKLAIRCRAAAAAARLHRQDPQAPSPRYIELLGHAEIDKGLEEALLKATFQNTLKALGPGHPITKNMLEGRTPEAQARRVVHGTQLHEPDFLRRAARAKGQAGLRALKDPMLNLHLRLEAATTPFCKEMFQAQQQEREHLDKIERARYRAYRGKVYPDADGTLRLSFGVVKGYTSNRRRIPPKTTIGGLLARCDSFDGQKPYDLPARFLTQRTQLDTSTPLNFVCTADIANGNSGSPVVNRQNEVVGVVFDGNLESLGNSFVYDQKQARAVCVHSTAILEILEKVYKARHLVNEIGGTKR